MRTTRSTDRARLAAIRLLALLVAPAWLAACGDARQGSAVWTPLAAGELGARQEAQHARALAARDALSGELLATLSAELERSGPAAAIAVCREEAPRIARAVGERHELRIGRTSWKLRNPANAPPAWAAALLAERPESPRLAADGTGRLGVSLPIRLAGACLACHGVHDELAPDVRAALAELYPGDRATGFREGDLRGWFWIEVPAAP